MCVCIYILLVLHLYIGISTEKILFESSGKIRNKPSVIT